jgi:hypothetical protein
MLLRQKIFCEPVEIEQLFENLWQKKYTCL